MAIRARSSLLGVALLVSLSGAALAALEPAADMEREIVRRVNAIRAENKRAALRVDPTLAKIARQYSCALARRGALSHTDREGKSVADRVRGAGKTYRAVGENLASSTNMREPVPTAVDGWMQSPGHRKNILHPDFTQTGVGVCRDGSTYYFTQVFLRPADPR